MSNGSYVQNSVLSVLGNTHDAIAVRAKWNDTYFEVQKSFRKNSLSHRQRLYGGGAERQGILLEKHMQSYSEQVFGEFLGKGI